MAHLREQKNNCCFRNFSYICEIKVFNYDRDRIN